MKCPQCREPMKKKQSHLPPDDDTGDYVWDYWECTECGHTEDIEGSGRYI